MIKSIRSMAGRLREEVGVYQMVMRDPRTPWCARVLVGAAVAYVLSPIDLVPDFIPVLGYADDLVVVALLLWVGGRMIPDEVFVSARGASRRRDGTTDALIRPTTPARR